MPFYGDARYPMTRRLELSRHRLLRWNQIEVSDIFIQVEVEANITHLQRQEDREGGLQKADLGRFRCSLLSHHSLLR